LGLCGFSRATPILSFRTPTTLLWSGMVILRAPRFFTILYSRLVFCLLSCVAALFTSSHTFTITNPSPLDTLFTSILGLSRTFHTYFGLVLYFTCFTPSFNTHTSFTSYTSQILLHLISLSIVFGLVVVFILCTLTNHSCIPYFCFPFLSFLNNFILL